VILTSSFIQNPPVIEKLAFFTSECNRHLPQLPWRLLPGSRFRSELLIFGFDS
jgi:hypothetical protein